MATQTKDERVAQTSLVTKMLQRPELGALIGALVIFFLFWSVDTTGNFAAACCSERHALIDKPAHRLGAMLDDSRHDIAVAESYARVERIADVGVYAVLLIRSFN